MDYSCISDIGLIREKNQDSYLAINNDYGDYLFTVADGIGGGRAGEVASNEIVEYFKSIFVESGPFESLRNASEFIKYHLNKVNRVVYDKSMSNNKYYGMGSTLTGIFVTKFGTLSINCGDSRVYGFIDNKIIQLTTDHTLVNQMVEKGEITYEESLNHPKKHYLVKAIGIFPKVECNVHKIKDMDYYLICSDGLHGYVDESEICQIVFDQLKSIEEKTLELKDIALLKGGYDNITVILVKR